MTAPTKTAEDQLNELFDNVDISDVKFTENEKKSPNVIPPVIQNITPEWWKLLTPDTNTSEQLQTILNGVSTMTIKPSHGDILNFARFTPLKELKVVILGQDPYDTENHAHGLAFSSQQPNTPKSLNNMFKALRQSGFLGSQEKPITNNLTGWAAQGVLLLNTALTVLPGMPESHLSLWEKYIQTLLVRIARFATTTLKRKLVIILWGAKAKKFAPLFEAAHYILEYHHPSPLAGDFSGCPNFTDCNRILAESKQTPVNWNPDFASWVEVYTDGSSFPNTTGPNVQSGYSVIFTAGVHVGLKAYGKTPNVPPHYSNNIRAEGTALLTALTKVAGLPLENRRVFHIVTDCEFWINMIKEWIPAWIEKGGVEEFENHKNPDLVTKIWEHYTNLLDTGTNIILTHVYSHDKKKSSKAPQYSTEYRRFFYNKLADALANNARNKLQNSQYGETTDKLECGGEKF
jgi:uracil-DNA glycosylase